MKSVRSVIGVLVLLAFATLASAQTWTTEQQDSGSSKSSSGRWPRIRT